MLIVITEVVQDLQTVQHAPIVQVVPIVLQVVLCGVCSGGSSKRKTYSFGGYSKRNLREVVVI